MMWLVLPQYSLNNGHVVFFKQHMLCISQHNIINNININNKKPCSTEVLGNPVIKPVQFFTHSLNFNRNSTLCWISIKKKIKRFERLPILLIDNTVSASTCFHWNFKNLCKLTSVFKNCDICQLVIGYMLSEEPWEADSET